MRAAEFLSEGDGSIARARQEMVWRILPGIMQKAGIPFRPSKELTPGDSYPRLGSIKISDGYYGASAGVRRDGKTALITLNIDVSTSNELYRGAQPQRVAAITAEAEHIAQALGGTVIPYSNSYAKHQVMAPIIEFVVPLPDISAPAQKGTSSYDPLQRFLNTPGERAKQSRIQGSAYSSSFGGDSSNYRY